MGPQTHPAPQKKQSRNKTKIQAFKLLSWESKKVGAKGFDSYADYKAHKQKPNTRNMFQAGYKNQTDFAIRC
jgi:hypothetical protein